MPESDEALLRRAAQTATARKPTTTVNPQWFAIPEVRRPNRPEDAAGVSTVPAHEEEK